jgi:diaminohydroxyphosphoribosylaminopyrimidine deaminase/5-amino-6-(5-phosphoribosylamino)uracil reductase
MDTDAFFMEQALSLGERSRPFAGTNPPVGAVLVRNGEIIGRGFHRGPGTPHAEVAAMHDARASTPGAGQSLRGTTLYCTLEPCCHSGAGKRTPPCTEAVIAAGISRVVFASRDPNPRVAGRGAERLRAAGIRVEAGLLAERADELIESFSVSIRLRRPFIHLKWAQSLDGRLACRGGASRWITNSHARAAAHVLRARHDAIMVGAGTLRTDDPALTVRDAPLGTDAGTLPPLRVVLAGRSPLPESARLFSPCMRDRTLVLAARDGAVTAQCRSWGLRWRDVEPGIGGLPDLDDSLRVLYAEGVGSLLVEGGAALLSALVARSLWDAITVLTAPLILGDGISPIGDLGISSPDHGIRLENGRFEIGDGFLRFDVRNPAAGASEEAPYKEGACSRV